MQNTTHKHAESLEALKANIPAELHALPIWLLWKYVPNGKEKPKKKPYYVDDDARGETDTAEDRARLVALDAALAAFNPKRYDGLGIALGKVPGTLIHLSGIDCDNCVDGEGIAPPVQQVLAATTSYAEISPSQCGLKIFGFGDIGTLATPELEIYSGGRFFAVTGQRIQGEHLADLKAAAELARRRLIISGKSGRRKGGRNIAVTSYAGTLRARNLDKDKAWVLLKDHNSHFTPPLPERELRKVLESVWKYQPGFALTDLGNAERLIDRHGKDLHYITGMGWAAWSDHCWYAQQDKSDVGHVMTKVAETVRSIYAEAATEDDEARRKRMVAHAMASESRQKLEAAAALAKWQPEIADDAKNYDADPLLLGLRNGVYDLRRDEFRPGQREDYITLQADVAYDPVAVCPRWEQFQSEIHEGDAEMIAFKHRAWGYTLSGDASEQVLFMPYGEGANGKSTELAIIQTLMGAYAKKMEAETLLVRGTRDASNDVARLRGARFVPTVEVEDGRRMAESLVKQMTGEDAITARFLYAEFFQFKPIMKVWLATNHTPEISGTEHAIWRRILLIPYPARFDPRREPNLKPTLLSELAGILNWMIEGFRQWRHMGLAAPDVVLQASASYREEMDRVGNFLRECCKHGPEVHGRTQAVHVYRAFRDWCEANGARPFGARKFHERMERDHKLFRMDGNTGALRDYPRLLLLTTGYSSTEIDA